jgi:hypothetical protein
MANKPLTFLAFAVLLTLGSTHSAMAADPPAAVNPAEEGEAAVPPEEEGDPYPPDGVTDPDVTYPTDGSIEEPQGEMAVPNGEAPAPEPND